MVAVEVVSELVFNMGAVIKALKGGVKGAAREAGAAVRAMGRRTVKAVHTLGEVTVKGAKTAVSNVRKVAGAVLHEGRLIMKGMGEGLGRGIRSLDDLARRLWNKVRFRRFELERLGRHFFLYGIINPRLLLLKGSLEEVTFEGQGRPKLGEEAMLGKHSGIVVGIRDTDASSFVRRLEGMNPADRRAEALRLAAMDETARRAAIQQIGQTAENARILRANMTSGGVRAGRGTPGGGNAAHHIVPSTSANPAAERARDHLKRLGLNGVNDELNGVFVPPDIHARLHSTAYMQEVERALAGLKDGDRAGAIAVLDDLAERILNREFLR